MKHIFAGILVEKVYLELSLKSVGVKVYKSELRRS